LHAIVDSVLIVDREGRDASKRRESIERLMNRVDALVGIPLKFENEYDWIAFIPNRTTGVGALTKYFARMNGEWKVRGIELRQHSTCDWIRNLQEEMLEDLASEPFGAGPTIAAQRVEEEIKRLHRGEVPLRELVIGRRVRRETGEHRVVNLTAGALLRARDLGQRTPPGRKVRFAVTGWTRPDPADRIRLQSEVESGTTAISGERGDCEFYTPLAIRAASALLSPFGWNDEMIKGGSSIQTCLEAWI
jgi:DNA polymerase I